MDKLPMCRICLVENVNMYVVVNKNLHELYEKLTDIPFVTKDSRPILACFFCCAKLKQCFRFLRKCLEAEELFTLMMNGDYEPYPSISQDDLHYCTGFINSPTVHVSIVDECGTGSIAIKEEVPAICESQDDVIEPNDEYQSDDVDLEILNNTCLGTEDIPPHLSESDSGGDVKTEVEEEQEISKKKRRSVETDRAPVAKKPKLDTLEKKQEDTITPEIKKAGPEIIQITQKRTSTPFINTKPRVQNSIKNIALATNCRTNSEQDLKRFKCDTCRSSFRYKSYLTNHIRIHTGEKPYKCEISQSSFRQKGDLTKHIRIHTREKPFKCDVCQSSFSTNKSLKTHVRIHTGEKAFKCDVCQSSFSTNKSLKTHVRIHTGEKPFKCDVCQSSFRRNDYLKTHIRLHTGEKPFKCDVCQSGFRQKCDLTKHIRIHTGEKPYKCEICQSSFRQKGDLTIHIRMHTGEKPFKCDVCQSSFNRKENLKTHVRIHLREKPYKCEICQSCFSSNGSLKTHITIHTGVKPHKCEICQSSFRQKCYLTKHIRIHTREKPFKCDVCQSSFRQKCDLRRHIRTHTSKKPY